MRHHLHTLSRTGVLAATLATALAANLLASNAALAQTGSSSGGGKPAPAVDERRIIQPDQHASADMIIARVNGKAGFRAAGAPRDLVVIRLGDGSVFATATMEELSMGLVGDHKVPADAHSAGTTAAKSSKSDKPSLGAGKGKRPIASAKPKPQGQSASKPGSSGIPEIQIPDGGPTPFGEGGIAAAPEASPEEHKIVADFVFASIPAIFHKGSVSIYRGEQLVDRDLIVLH